jgi:hypothetical protein
VQSHPPGAADDDRDDASAVEPVGGNRRRKGMRENVVFWHPADSHSDE